MAAGSESGERTVLMLFSGDKLQEKIGELGVILPPAELAELIGALQRQVERSQRVNSNAGSALRVLLAMLDEVLPKLRPLDALTLIGLVVQGQIDDAETVF